MDNDILICTLEEKLRIATEALELYANNKSACRTFNGNSHVMSSDKAREALNNMLELEKRGTCETR